MADELKRESPEPMPDPQDLEAEALAAKDEDVQFTSEDTDISSQVQQELSKLHDGVWHAPRGPKTRIVAIAILLLMAVSFIGLLVVLAVTLLN